MFARLTAALTLLVIAIRPWLPLRQPRSRYGMLLVALLFTATVYWLQLAYPGYWPRMFEPGVGLTRFKIAAEYTLVALLLLAAWFCYVRRDQHSEFNRGHLITAILITVLSELCFTLYSNVNDIFSLLGHSYKVLAYVFIYRAVFVVSVELPYQRLRAEMVARQQAEARIDYLDFHDPLTGLPNRALALHDFDRALNHCQRSGNKLALVVIDIDNFRSVIESLGHGTGDALLKAVAGRIQALISERDMLSRQSGDEFLLTLGELPDVDAVQLTLNNIMQAFSSPFALNSHLVPATVSVGVSVYPDDAGDFDTLLKFANIAMFRAQTAGRARYRFFDEVMNKEALERLALLNGLHQAVQRNEFVLHYQPQIDLNTGAVIGAEALIRWQHPTLGLVSPARFIPLAEESGLIVAIGEWALRSACQQMVAWQQAGLNVAVVAVNLSAIQLLRSDLERTVQAVLQDTGLQPSALELELTESILIQDADRALAVVKRLRHHGVRFSIDDFGTGYSSLSYLKQFNVDKLKIDQSFVRDLLTDADGAAIVRTIILLAQSLGLRTIAEGVEEAAVLAMLRTLGCDEAQGYYLSRPIPAAEFSAFVSARQRID